MILRLNGFPIHLCPDDVSPFVATPFAWSPLLMAIFMDKMERGTQLGSKLLPRKTRIEEGPLGVYDPRRDTTLARIQEADAHKQAILLLGWQEGPSGHLAGSTHRVAVIVLSRMEYCGDECSMCGEDTNQLIQISSSTSSLGKEVDSTSCSERAADDLHALVRLVRLTAS